MTNESNNEYSSLFLNEEIDEQEKYAREQGMKASLSFFEKMLPRIKDERVIVDRLREGILNSIKKEPDGNFTFSVSYKSGEIAKYDFEEPDTKHIMLLALGNEIIVRDKEDGSKHHIELDKNVGK